MQRFDYNNRTLENKGHELRYKLEEYFMNALKAQNDIICAQKEI